MKNTYFITNGQIEVDIGEDYLSIIDRSKEGNSKSFFQKKNVIHLALTLLCFGFAFYIAYFSLYEVTIYCEKFGKDADVSCSVNVDYRLKGNEEIFSLQPVKQARIDHSFGETSTCRIELIKPNDELVLPLGSSHSSAVCGTDFETKIEPFFDYRQRTGKQTITFSNSAFAWVAIAICVGVFFGYLLPSAKFLLQVAFNRTERKVIVTHINTYGTSRKEYSFYNIKKVVFTGDPKSTKTTKTFTPRFDFYLLLADSKIVYLNFKGL